MSFVNSDHEEFRSAVKRFTDEEIQPIANELDAKNAEKNIAGVVSQVLILGSIDKDGKVILVHPSQKSENGLPIA